MENIQTIPRLSRWFPDRNKLVFGLFEQAEDAEATARVLASEAQAKNRRRPITQVHTNQLEREVLPHFATQAVRGALLGAVVGMFGVALLAGTLIVLAATDSVSSSLMAGSHVVFLVLAGGLFGALGGALSLSTRNRSLVRTLERRIEEGFSVLTVSVVGGSHDDVQNTLRQSGALEVGSLVSHYSRIWN